MLLKYGVEIGGCFVIEHQTEEAMAPILLAWTGEDQKLQTKKPHVFQLVTPKLSNVLLR